MLIKNETSVAGRNQYMDFLKAILIIFVVWGHTISSVNTNAPSLTDPLNLFFTSFHMPLFMLVSGYFAFFSESRRSAGQYITSKAKTVLFPLLLWNLIFFILNTIIQFISLRHIALTDSSFWIEFLSYMTSALWFLWALFFSGTILCVINKYVANSLHQIMLYALVSIILCIIPKTPFHLSFMFPFFCIGFCINKYNLFISSKTQHIMHILCYISLIVFPVLLFFYSKDSTIYINGDSIFGVPNPAETAFIILYRFVIGVAGSAFIYQFSKLAWRFVQKSRFLNLLTRVGRSTLEIYILHSFGVSVIFRKIMTYITLPDILAKNIFVLNFVICFILTIFFIRLSIFIADLLMRIPVVKGFIFGIK